MEWRGEGKKAIGMRKEKKEESCPVSLNEGRWACAREGKCCWPLGLPLCYLRSPAYSTVLCSM